MTDKNGNELGTQYLRVGDLARLTGKTVRAIHLYEELDLLQPATRSSGGFRLYSPAALERVRWIDLLQDMGFSLQEARTVLERWRDSEDGPEAMDELRALFGRKLEEMREQIRRKQQLEAELLEGLKYLETCRVCGESGAVDRCVDCAQPHDVEREPALLTGLKAAFHAPRRVVRPALVRVEDHAKP
jgi:DNA-binding transcriptional MerR regulator